MKRHLPLLIMVPLFLLTFYMGQADTQTDAGLLKWMRDQDSAIQTNHQLINHEQQRRMELEQRLIQMMNNDSQNVRGHIVRLENRIHALESRMYSLEQALKKLVHEGSGN